MNIADALVAGEKETIAIDPFIGEPDMLGCGHGSRFLTILAERLRAEGARCRH